MGEKRWSVLSRGRGKARSTAGEPALHSFTSRAKPGPRMAQIRRGIDFGGKPNPRRAEIFALPASPTGLHS
jgi:hypothetical protein